MKSLIVALCLLFASLANATANNPSLEEVATYALKKSFNEPSGDHWEYGGIIVYRDGKLVALKPITLQSDSGTNIPIEQVGKYDVLMGMYHTHPCRSRTYFPKYFSQLDLRLPKHFKVPAFILDECTGDIHEFDPLKDDPNENGDLVMKEGPYGLDYQVFLTYGRVIGNIGVRGVDLDDEDNK